MRTLQNLLAVDAVTGKRLWEVPVDETAETAPGTATRDVQMRQAMLASGVGSADVGRHDLRHAQQRRPLRVLGRGLGVGIGAGAPRDVPPSRHSGKARVHRGSRPRGANNEQPALCNRLAAHDIRTGKLKWQLGGPAGQYALRQSGDLLSRPAVASDGAALRAGRGQGRDSIAGVGRRHRRSRSGRSNWPRRKQNIAKDPNRRLAGASPSYADGILVCPTSAGAVVGVELATRSLLWGYCYSPNHDNDRRNNGIMFLPPNYSAEQPPRTGSTAAPRSARAACWSLRWNRSGSIA